MQNGKVFSGREWARRLTLAVALIAAPIPLAAQQPAGDASKPAAPKTETPAPAPAQSPAKDAAGPAAPEPAKPDPAKPDSPKAEAPKDAPAEEGAIKVEDIAARVTIQAHGAAKWEEGYAKIAETIAKLRAAAQKAGLKETGRPLAVFTDTDDAGFKFDAMLPVEAPADSKADLGADVSIGQAPSGKAVRFEHRGAYDDIDSTYEAITAYLDEKGLEARNLFVEEYVAEAKDSSDVALQVDIYVFLK
ncbi:GyrI-like domain-containing protein [Rhodoblastus sp. 17X3]|uniref:GyrI-like domain-containing protein n=1 Tax=Rhodoblastus sp. 17X3 TaxID=3047026 RepID=UPI0024B74AFE|nr:GyrI-like domain-containing protein [Rhodoblastus sp. 17X3]MDI9848940.1 GyrI-like domain-containing protein [Rhodoblastus sp. 17X3]